jgi:two-component system, OmpR family, sensor histidine kinase KdpD
MQQLGETLRSADGLPPMAEALHNALAQGAPAGVVLMMLQGEMPAVNDDAALVWAGAAPSADERIGLWLCLREGTAFGVGTGRHSELPGWYLPIQGDPSCWGAALLRRDALADPDPMEREHAQRLCDLTGQAVQRLELERRASLARAEAETQALRSALLMAISHDFRTPLASILGAASALEHQSPRIGESQRRQLLTQIQDEARALSAMADNTLQLVRLESGQIELRTDWESPEELAGMALARVRRRDPQRRIRARIEPGLPLLRVDAPLLLQLIENLLDNALKYSEGPVDLVARRFPPAVSDAGEKAQPGGQRLLMAVKDRGPGIAAAQRERLFRIFQRGDGVGSQRGAGLGLAVCRAIAGLHGGELTVRNRSHGGSSFELLLPCPPAPELASLPAPLPLAHEEVAP